MQIVTTSQIVETLLTKGEVVLPDFGEGNRIKIQQHMYQAKKQLAKQGMGVMPEYDGYFIRSYKLLSANHKPSHASMTCKQVMQSSVNLNDKSAIYKVIHSKIVKMNSKRILESELKGFNNREVLQSVLTDLGYRKYRGVWQK